MKNLIFVLAFLALSVAAEPNTPAGPAKQPINSEILVAPTDVKPDFTPIDVKDVSDDLNRKLDLSFDEVAPAQKVKRRLMVSID
jgi:hypothetical protein